MKKITSILLVLLLGVCLLAGCSSLEMPNGFNNVVSNGGFVVGAGDYMFFANGYKSYSSLTEKSDNDGDVGAYSLNRTKIDRTASNRKWFDIEKDEDENAKIDLVAQKITAYQSANIYVVGEYIYFTSPNVHKSDKNEYEFNLSSLFRVRLDGTGLCEFYTTVSSNAKFYLTGNEKQQLLIYDDETIKAVDVYKGETKVKTVLTTDVKVASVQFPSETGGEVAYLYFTVNRTTSGFNGNLLYRFSVETGEAKEVKNVVGSNETITLLDYKNGVLFYSITNGNNDGIYSNSTGFASGTNSIKHISFVDQGSDFSNVTYVKCDDEDYNCFAFVYGGKLYIQPMSSNNIAQAIKLSDKADAKIQFVDNGYIYYSTSDGIYRVSVRQRIEQQLSAISDFNSDVMDFDGRFVYFFAKEENVTSETYYLYRADTYLDEVRVECVAKLLEKDIAESEQE